MTRTWIAGTLLMGALAIVTPRGMAQDPQPSKGNDAPAVTKTGGEPQTVTGCIQRGDAEAEYKIATKDGEVWDLDSKKIKISPHVNHTVKISGVVIETFDKAKPRKIVTNDNRRGILAVTKLEMIEAKCEQ